eukprot:TRINITY_DN9442_c0_g1_i1.p1 TRINITY_DN9442_c0_g1~~TRINITY_DN9442_c0_g1_i1.p1  ORF type:complete len:229 (+),score=3.61 TRINITY_DN9442_c0_g1_i1:41-688(+)
MTLAPLPVDSVVEYHEKFIDDPESVFHQLRQCIEFEQTSISLYGKSIPEPRLTALFGDSEVGHYTYSRSKREVKPWPSPLADIRDKLFTKFGVRYNLVLCNLYRDGNDCIAPHSDDPTSIDPTDISSVSLGCPRTFLMHRKRGKLLGERVMNRKLASGSVLRMKGQCQDEFKHSVPREPGVSQPRINLTFRLLKPKLPIAEPPRKRVRVDVTATE